MGRRPADVGVQDGDAGSGVGESLAGLREHRWAGVDADDVAALRAEVRGDAPRADADLEDGGAGHPRVLPIER